MSIAFCGHSSFGIRDGEKLIIIIKAFLPLKVAGNYAVKQNSIVHLSARKMQMST